MKVLLLILGMIISVIAETLEEETILEKLIIPSSNTKVSLEAIQKYCNEDETLHSLQEKYNFHIEIQRLGDYNVTVITPLKSITLRNTLFIILSPLYKDIFYIKMKDKKNKSSLLEEESLGLEWIVLCILSLVGFILSIQSRMKIGQLMKSQDKLQKEQKKMEEEIKSLGGDSEKSI